MKMRRAAVHLALVVLTYALAPFEAAAQEHCNALLSHGIRNEWSAISQKEWNNLIFHQHCRKTDNSWSFSHNGQVGLKSPVPIGIAGDWFASQADRVEFCRKQADSSQGREMEASRLSLLSAEALTAWNQCQLLAEKNVEIAASDLDGRLLGFSIRRKGSDPITLKTITFEGAASCSVAGDQVSSGKPLAIKVDQGQITIRCIRAEAVAAKGFETSYKRTEIGIDTSEGSLDINLPPIDRPYPQTVAELRRDLELRLGARVVSRDVVNLKTISSSDSKAQRGYRSSEETKRDFCVLTLMTHYAGRSPSCELSREDERTWKLTAARTKKEDGTVRCSATCFNLGFDEREPQVDQAPTVGSSISAVPGAEMQKHVTGRPSPANPALPPNDPHL